MISSKMESFQNLKTARSFYSGRVCHGMQISSLGWVLIKQPKTNAKIMEDFCKHTGQTTLHLSENSVTFEDCLMTLIDLADLLFKV